MTVNADAGSHPFELDGETYWFCCVGCHDRFAADPARYLSAVPTDGEA
jgi:YHS domain-containing protein